MTEGLSAGTIEATARPAGEGLTKIPPSVIAAVIALTVLPSLLTLVGVDFSLPVFDPTSLDAVPRDQVPDAVHRLLAGTLIHTILEWSAFCAAVFIAFLALMHFGISRDVTTPVIGLALFFAGMVDAFHILAADRLIEAVSDTSRFIPFTWAISRTFSAVIMITGVGLFLVRGPVMARSRLRTILLAVVAFGLLAYGATVWSASSPSLPVTVFPDRLVKRPYDLPALFLFLVAGLVYLRFHRARPSLFAHALVISVVPEVATQLHMVFWSGELFDNSFNIAHYLKVVAYLVPLVGLGMDYIWTYQNQARALSERDRALERLTVSEEKFSSLFQYSHDGILLYDRAGRLLDANQRALEQFGYTRPELQNLNLRDLHPETALAQYEWASTELADRGAVRFEIDFQKQNGDLFPAEVSANTLHIVGGEVVQSVIRDITERRKVETELRRAREHEIEIAGSIQDMFLRGIPPRNLVEFTIDYLADPSQRVDGDFVDFFTHREGCVDIVVGDVMGKGNAAALLGAATKSQFARALAALLVRTGPNLPEPEDIVNVVHDRLTGRLLALESFVTANYARFDVAERQLTFVDCGHPGILRYRALTGECTSLKGDNLPLGFLESHEYRQRTVAIEDDDLFVLYSDGLTEVRNAEGEMFGEQRLKEVVTSVGHKSPREVTQAVHRAAKSFAVAEHFDDDLTLVVARVGPSLVRQPLVQLTDQVPRDPSALSRIRALVADVVARAGPEWADVDYVTELQQAVQEAVTNIIHHAVGGDPSTPIEVVMNGFADEVSVLLFYEGKPFWPAVIEAPVVEDHPEGGFGLYIIEQLVHSARSFVADDGRSCTHLIKRWKR